MGLFEFFKTYFNIKKKHKKIKDDQLEKCINLKNIFNIFKK